MEIRSGVKPQSTEAQLKKAIYMFFHPGNMLSISQNHHQEAHTKVCGTNSFINTWWEPFAPAFHRVKSVKIALRSSILASMSCVISFQLPWRLFLLGIGEFTMFFIEPVINACTYHQPRSSSLAVSRLDTIWTLEKENAHPSYKRQSLI